MNRAPNTITKLKGTRHLSRHPRKHYTHQSLYISVPKQCSQYMYVGLLPTFNLFSLRMIIYRKIIQKYIFQFIIAVKALTPWEPWTLGRKIKPKKNGKYKRIAQKRRKGRAVVSIYKNIFLDLLVKLNRKWVPNNA